MFGRIKWLPVAAVVTALGGVGLTSVDDAAGISVGLLSVVLALLSKDGGGEQ